jgi:hypothetical protein
VEICTICSTVLNDAVVFRLAENSCADLVLAQTLSVAMQSPFSDEAKQFSQAGRFREVLRRL